DRTPDSFPTIVAQPNTAGLIGTVNVTNHGNIKIYFKTLTREAASPLIVISPQGFSSDILSRREINISYSVPPTYPENLYYGIVAIRNDTLPADPVERIISFYLNVTDLGPNITAYNVTPENFEVSFDTVYINATIIDNFGVDKAWIKVRRPGFLNYTNLTIQQIDDSAGDYGYNYTEETMYEGIMDYFNITINNKEAFSVYVNMSVNDVQIVTNQNISSTNNFTVDAIAQGVNFTLPGNSTINVTYYNIVGTPISAATTSWLEYQVQGEYYIEFMGNNGSLYNTTYWTNRSGDHKMWICANDTGGRIGCTDMINLTAAGNTSIGMYANETIVNVTNITLYTSQNFTLDFNVTNIGYARAYNLTMNATVPTDWSAYPVDYSFGTIYTYNQSNDTIEIMVPANTTPGIYSVNFTANWTNINTSYPGINTTTIYFNVTENQVVDLQDRIPPIGQEYIMSGETRNITVNVTSVGNTPAVNLTFNCSTGVVCQNFTITFYPQIIDNLSVGQILESLMEVNVPGLYAAGQYSGIVGIGNNYTNDSAYVYVEVPENISWSMTPSSMDIETIHGTSGHMGQIEVENTGNAPVRLTVDWIGGIFSHLTWAPTVIDLDLAEIEYIDINYTAPIVSQYTVYSGNMTTVNETGLDEMSSLSMTVHPYDVNIISPTESSPLLNVSVSDEVEVKVNVTYGNYSVWENTTFNITLLNSTMSIAPNITSTNYNATDELWYVNFTAPDIAEQKGYDINATVHYSLTSNWTIEYYDYEAKAVVYKDEEPPSILIIVPARVPANNTAEIFANVTDPGGVFSSNITVYYPSYDANTSGNETNGTNATLYYTNDTMTFLYKYYDTYVYGYNFTNTSELGVYTINVTGFDMSGNENTTTNTFEIFIGIWFSGYAKDIWKYEVQNITEIIDQSFEMWNDISSGTMLFDFTSDPTTGYYNQSLDAMAYDVKTEFWNDSITFLTTQLTTDVSEPIQIGTVPRYYFGDGCYRNIMFYDNLNYSTALLTLDYSAFASEMTLSNVGVYQCVTFNSSNLVCPGSWTRLTSILSVNDTTLTINSTNLDGVFSIANYICGDGTCESAYGESEANCADDCAEEGGGEGEEDEGEGGGGGGAGAGGGVVVPPPPSAGGSQVPVEIKSTLIFVTLRPGEHEIHSIDVTNNLGSAVEVETSVTGNAWELVQIEKPTMTIGGKSTEVLKIKLYALPTTQPGIYTGDIIAKIKSRNITHITPVTIKVERPPEPLLDVKVKALTKSVEPGGDLKFEITLLNMGATATIDDIVVTYEIKGLYTNKLIKRSSETIAVDSVKSFTKTIPIPEDTPY
ncbi:MAG: hypothetical protein KAS32_06885, partial [Candidatus Peribacteraceae bacterium]|nr:hypothetical protein [Candidatus Peribacteraceae bacterium]